MILIKTILSDLDLNADLYQDVLFQSHITHALEVLLFIFSLYNFCDFFLIYKKQTLQENVEEKTHLVPNSTFHMLKMLKTFFLNSTDPEAGLPKLRKSLLIFIDMAEVEKSFFFIF